MLPLYVFNYISLQNHDLICCSPEQKLLIELFMTKHIFFVFIIKVNLNNIILVICISNFYNIIIVELLKGANIDEFLYRK